MLEDCPNKPNCVCTSASRKEQRMTPLRIGGDVAAVIALVEQVLERYPRTKIVKRSRFYVHATFTSRLLRFVDDVEFEVDEPRKILHFRSASRLGYSDLGANRQRMQQITEDLLQLDGLELAAEA